MSGKKKRSVKKSFLKKRLGKGQWPYMPPQEKKLAISRRGTFATPSKR